jgi:DNA-binding GntR family transcriptional regulator
MTTAASSDPRLYVRLADALRGQIGDGTLAKDSRLPSIGVLCLEYSLSRQTAAKALRMLEDEGLIHRVPGLGYHVS